VTKWTPAKSYDIWHDRAALHFFTTDADRGKYLNALDGATSHTGFAILATFALDGPPTCSGLAVARYDSHELASLLGDRWRLVTDGREEHKTPGGGTQPFTWAAFSRLE
jgi:predicted ATPase